MNNAEKVIAAFYRLGEAERRRVWDALRPRKTRRRRCDRRYEDAYRLITEQALPTPGRRREIFPPVSQQDPVEG